ncbi:MAG TPA: UDPGP type 1 family protein [Fibrobacteria bacterium]|nr:UDPGP type 1 family protein [Fibrobacteria bacterium]
MTYESALDVLTRHGQTHLLRFWNELDAAARETLLAEIAAIDFDLVAGLHRDLVTTPAGAGAAASMDRTPASLSPLRGQNIDEARRAVFRDEGLKPLAQGRCAAFLVAGGQGTRLGHDGPKGVFDIGLPSGKSLFQLQAERLKRLGALCGKPVPWYIMTSRENHAATTGFFREHDYFGLNESDIMFFPQGECPLTDQQGRILLADKGRIALGPNGNGGCFPALKHAGALADMERRGVEWVFVYSVDNALVRVCDPVFLGFALASGLPAASKAVAKSSPEERVGVFCRRGDGPEGGRPSVIEYSEMSPELCAARDGDGELLYGSANIAVHLFRRDFLEAHADAALPWHVAHKKIPHIAVDAAHGNAPGARVIPSAPNAYKFELFMFDLFPMAPDMAVLNVERAAEFAPVKNRDGADSPATARALILALHRRWAEQAGAPVLQSPVGAGTDLEVEISPTTSYAGEGLSPESFTYDGSRNLLTA